METVIVVLRVVDLTAVNLAEVEARLREILIACEGKGQRSEKERPGWPKVILNCWEGARPGRSWSMPRVEVCGRYPSGFT